MIPQEILITVVDLNYVGSGSFLAGWLGPELAARVRKSFLAGGRPLLCVVSAPADPAEPVQTDFRGCRDSGELVTEVLNELARIHALPYPPAIKLELRSGSEIQETITAAAETYKAQLLTKAEPRGHA